MPSSYTNSGIPIGTQIMHSTIQPGYLLCDGSAVSRTTYASLFAIIGTTYGSGNGSTTFNLPDARGRFVRFRDGGINRDPDRTSRLHPVTGVTVGDVVGSVQDDVFKSHTHVISMNTSNSMMDNDKNTNSVEGVGGVTYGRTVLSATAADTGGNETRPKNFSLNLYIKYF